MASVESPVALITGGASGIGLALAKDLAAKNWNFAIFDFNEDSLSSAQGEFEKSRVVMAQGDVADYASEGEAFARIWNQWHRLDFVFANAGIVDGADLFAPATEFLPDFPDAPIRPDLKVLDVDLTGVAYLALHFFRKNASKGGKLVFTASEAGLYAAEGIPGYCASKHGVVGLTRVFSKPLTGSNVTVNCICPDLVPTRLTTGYVANTPASVLTSMSTVLRAVNQFIEDDSLTGKVAECSGENIYYREQPEYVDKRAKFVLTQKY